MTVSGGRCPRCSGGTMVRYKTRTTGVMRTRYLKCDLCGHLDSERLTLQTDEHGRRKFLPAEGKAKLECPCCGHIIEAT